METLRSVNVVNYALSASKAVKIKYTSYGVIKQLAVRSFPSNTRTVYLKVSTTTTISNGYPLLPSEEYKANINVNQCLLYAIATGVATISVMYHST